MRRTSRAGQEGERAAIALAMAFLAAVWPGLSLAQGGRAGHRALVERIEWEMSDAGASVIVVVKGRVDYSSHVAPADPATGLPPRAYVDLRPAQLGKQVSREPLIVDDRLVRRIRIGQFDPDTTRVVLDLSRPARLRVETRERPTRLILRLARIEGDSADASAPRVETRAPASESRRAAETRVTSVVPRESARPPPVQLAEARPTPSPEPPATPSPAPAARTPEPSLHASPSPEPKTVVIDPGHGGRDPGAQGPFGPPEKDLTLALAQLIEERLEEDGDLRVVLTRTDDRYVSLEERTATANAQGAELFVSIHVNASESESLDGVETYTLNNTEDQATIRLAALENGLTLAGAAPGERDLAYILSDLVQTGKEDESIVLARAVQGELVRYLRTRWRNVSDLGVKKGPFYVLVGAYMPCILVEVGFLTHSVEGPRISTQRYQRDLAEGIAAGIRRFLATPPPGANL